MAGCSKEFKDYKIGEMSDMDGVNNCPTCATNLSNYVQCLQSIKKVEYKLGMAKWRIERDKLRIKQLEEKTEYLEHPLSATERIKQLEDKNERQFLNGLLYAIQELVVSHGEDTIAEEFIKNSGYSLDEFLKSQKESGFQTGKMNAFIKKALEK